MKKYEDDITKYKAVIEAEEKILEESMDSAAREKKQNLIQAHLKGNDLLGEFQCGFRF